MDWQPTKFDKLGPESPPRLLAFLRTQPGRCTECGAHVGKQGHRGFCSRWSIETSIEGHETRGHIDGSLAVCSFAFATVSVLAFTFPEGTVAFFDALVKVAYGLVLPAGVVVGLMFVVLSLRGDRT